jgi:hypothetical protein
MRTSQRRSSSSTVIDQSNNARIVELDFDGLDLLHHADRYDSESRTIGGAARGVDFDMAFSVPLAIVASRSPQVLGTMLKHL